MSDPASGFTGVIVVLAVSLAANLGTTGFCLSKTQPSIVSVGLGSLAIKISGVLISIWLIVWLTMNGILLGSQRWSTWYNLVHDEVSLVIAMPATYYALIHLQGVESVLATMAYSMMIYLQYSITRKLSSRYSRGTILGLIIVIGILATVISVIRFVLWEGIVRGHFFPSTLWVYPGVNYAVIGVLNVGAITTFICFFFGTGSYLQKYWSQLLAIHCLTLLRHLEQIFVVISAEYLTYTDNFAAADELLGALLRGLTVVTSLAIFAWIVYDDSFRYKRSFL